MRTWVCGAMLLGVTAGAVAFVFAGSGSPSHCGPCVTAAPEQPEHTPALPVGEPVTDVVDLAAALTAPPARERESFISFDEPPLARPRIDPRAPKEMPGPGVVQASFLLTSPAPELAPMPRRLPVQPPSPFSSPSDPF